jgi:serine/threonine-protein kinase
MSSTFESAIGRYQILSFIARGTRTIVYEALDPESGRHVALKILPPSAARDAQQARDFLRLAEELSRLDHPNLLPVIDYGREDGVPFVTTPIAAGGRLDQHLAEYGEPEDALTLVVALADAVDYLHRNDIVHGRIEPANVLLDERGRPLLAGVSRRDAPAAPPSDPAYVAPELRQEQVSGGTLVPDELGDIYQLGVLLYQLLLNELPDAGDEAPLTIDAFDLDEEVKAILRKAMASDPDERFQTAGELAAQLNMAAGHPRVLEADIEEISAIESVEAPSPVEPESSGSILGLPLQNMNPLWLVGAAVVLALILTLCCLLTVFAVSSISGRFSRPRATAQIDTNVRAGPSIEYQIVGILRQGEQASIHGVSPDGRWWQISFEGAPGGRGWLPASFVTVDQLGTVDIVAPPPRAPQAALPPPTGWLESMGYE